MEAEGRRSLVYPRRDQSVRAAGTLPTSRCARPLTAPLVARIQDGFLQCSRRSAQGRPRRPSSSGRASAAIAPVHASHDVVVLEHPAFPCGGATLLNLAAEPLVMVDRAGQQVKRHLVRRASSLRSEPRQLRFEFGRNLQVHETSVGCLDIGVNRRLAPHSLVGLRQSKLSTGLDGRKIIPPTHLTNTPLLPSTSYFSTCSG